MFENAFIFVFFLATFVSVSWSVSVEEILLSSNEVARENEIENVPSSVSTLFSVFLTFEVLLLLTFI